MVVFSLSQRSSNVIFLFDHFFAKQLPPYAMGSSRMTLHLLKVIIEIADRLPAPLRLMQFAAHAFGDGVAEHPDFLAFSHEHDVHKEGEFTFLQVCVRHELRKMQYGAERYISPVYGKAAEPARPFAVAGWIISVWATDIHEREEGGFNRLALLTLDFAYDLEGDGVVTAGGVESFIPFHQSHLLFD